MQLYVCITVHSHHCFQCRNWFKVQPLISLVATPTQHQINVSYIIKTVPFFDNLHQNDCVYFLSFTLWDKAMRKRLHCLTTEWETFVVQSLFVMLKNNGVYILSPTLRENYNHHQPKVCSCDGFSWCVIQKGDGWVFIHLACLIVLTISTSTGDL